MDAYNFNPHEREARDNFPEGWTDLEVILIHTSVKLVTAIHHLQQV